MWLYCKSFKTKQWIVECSRIDYTTSGSKVNNSTDCSHTHYNTTQELRQTECGDNHSATSVSQYFPGIHYPG